MCLYPKLIKNPKYKANKKNGGRAPFAKDKRLLYVPIGCGECIECRKQKANAWRVRLAEELRKNPQAKFVTLTFNEEYLSSFKEITTDENEIAAMAIRKFLERWRKEYRHSLRHWFVTEKGQENTERIHLHGIIFKTEKTTDNEWDSICDNQKLTEKWKYGITDIGYMCNAKTINYLVKYMLKPDLKHDDFKTKVMASAGIGSGWQNRIDSQACTYKDDGTTRQEYSLPNGNRIRLPMYYRNKIYNEDERETLWLEALDKKERYVNGIRMNIRTPEEFSNFMAVLKDQQEYSERLGYKRPDWKENDTKPL